MLSDLMPTLQNFAIEVLSEDAHQFRPRLDGKVTRATCRFFPCMVPARSRSQNSRRLR